jgi:uncharacterized protein
MSVQARHGVLRFLIIGSLGLLAGCTADPTKQTLDASGTVPLSVPSGSSADQPVPTVAVSSPVPLTSTAPTTLSPPSSGLAPTGPTSTGLTSTGSAAGLRLVAAARSQIGITTGYDPAYVGLSFPGGDVDETTGVCSDVVVRALRGLGIDLQERVNLDMKAHFGEYPTKWGLSSPDPNIDHRRVPNLATYFARRGYEQAVTTDPANYQPGDIVWLKLPLDHTGIVSDRRVEGRPLLIHNVGRGAQEEDVLFSWKIVGHYRVVR